MTRPAPLRGRIPMKGTPAQPSTALSYGDYVEQLTLLLFLKMADEQSRSPFKKPSPIPKGFGWDVLVKLDGDELETHYRHTLEELGKRPGMLGVICLLYTSPS